MKSAFPNNSVEFHEFRPRVLRSLLRDKWIVSEDSHSEVLRQARNFAADASQSDDPKHRSFQISQGEFVTSFPLPTSCLDVELSQSLGASQNHAKSSLRDCPRACPGSINNGDSPAGGSFEIYTVVA